MPVPGFVDAVAAYASDRNRAGGRATALKRIRHTNEWSLHRP